MRAEWKCRTAWENAKGGATSGFRYGEGCDFVPVLANTNTLMRLNLNHLFLLSIVIMNVVRVNEIYINLSFVTPYFLHSL